MATTVYKTVICPSVFINHDEDDTGLIIDIELPGVVKEAIELNVRDQGFCVSAEREDTRFDGCFQFAHLVNRDEVKAKFENGLLKFTVPFKEPLRGRTISIE